MNERVYNALPVHRQLGAFDHCRGHLRRDGAGRFRAFSAGSNAKGKVHPYALQLLENLNYDASSRARKAGTNTPSLTRLKWISSSRFATTLPTRSAR